MSINVGLIITSAIFALLILIASVYFLVYFQHPEDKWVAWFPKAIVVLGLTLAAYNIFLLPLDVANQGGTLATSGAIPMEKLTLAFYITTCIITVVGVPFTVFYYEGEDDTDDEEAQTSHKGQLVYAIKWLIPTVIVTAVLIFILWYKLGYAIIAATRYEAPLHELVSATGNISEELWPTVQDYCTLVGSAKCKASPGKINVPVSALIYIIAIITAVGWILFAFFGGAGLFTLPYDCFQSFRNRPRPIKAAEYAERKKKLGEYAVRLKEVAKDLQDALRQTARSNGKTFSRRYRSLKAKEAQFRKNVLFLDYHYRRLEDSYKFQGGNLIWQICVLIFGIIGAFISVLWFIQICIYTIPFEVGSSIPAYFLNSFLTSVSKVPVIGIVIYSIFAFYLLGCVVKGNVKVGMRVFFMTVHPMRMGETMMNSLVFNVGIILLASLAVAQFCTISFNRFAQFTASQRMFTTNIGNFAGMKWFYVVLTSLFLAVSVLSMCMNVYKPKRRNNDRMTFKL
ncbi:hypothetical protein CXG81DRAFT_20453 [Caulochytrium protostelioides]|uniref:LMBR1-domain-containing protein n=1 Tax=Caulochytrium protostelioides TaxID=1555241 RepID=A0A4P9X296_9FUNG|nr:hypothetical protein CAUPRSCDRAFT_10222 [Caulochytrium protostelioides]RKO99460.1 hypothetical protein CXG81DRAFT_20453 [Caulochytrium protostelioides]|eukprot:RKO99460.1 hypothetical protein CXG81DRAFT_20453 [Caulochytrium protostelioides]